MSHLLTDTGIVAESYNGRGLFCFGADTRNLVRTDTGELWAAVRENLTNKWINIYHSTDGGFSWRRAWQGNLAQSGFRKAGLSGLNHNGNFMHLSYHDHENRLILWHSLYDTADSRYKVEPFVFDNSNGILTRIEDGSVVDAFNTGHDQLAFDIAYNKDTIFMTTVQGSALVVRAFKPYVQSAAQGTWNTGTTFFNMFSTATDPWNQLHIVVLEETEDNYRLVYTRLNKANGAFTTPVAVRTRTGKFDIIDLSLAIDDAGTLCLAYSEIKEDLSAVAKFATSTDNGETWVDNTIETTEGQSSYTDAIVQADTARTTVLGGIGGFILGYTRDLEGVPTSYARTLYRTGETEYTLGSQQTVHETYKPVTGVKFFRTPATSLQDLSDPGEIRVAYQIGEGNSTIQLDTVPVEFKQKLLKHGPFAPASTSYAVDTPEDHQLLLNLDIIDATSQNIDFYDAGVVGHLTQRYISAFDRVGTKTQVDRYEPKPESVLSDRTAYQLTDIIKKNLVWDVLTYELPVIPDQDDFSEYIERDIRKVYLPPDLHLARTLLLNEGNYLKRTVWLAYYDGNTYELTQVVPHFIDNQICLYTANAYVVGPSRDPFSRVILPSET